MEALEVTWGDHQSEEAPLGTMNVCIKATNKKTYTAMLLYCRKQRKQVRS